MQSDLNSGFGLVSDKGLLKITEEEFSGPPLNVSVDFVEVNFICVFIGILLILYFWNCMW